MSKIAIGTYGIINYLIQRQRKNNITSQNLINIHNNDIIEPKDIITIKSFTEYKTEDNNGIIGFVTPGKYNFIGIGKSNNKCLVQTDENKILVYSKGCYDIKILANNIKKIRIKSNEDLILKICYWDYSISEITNIISNYFKNNKITEITNLTDNLDENWNDILSISLNNSLNNNNFENPKIEIISKNINKDITEISNKYNFKIILENFKKSNKDIIDDPHLISIISQDYEIFNFNSDELLIWIMKYIEIFTISTGKFFKYLENQNFNTEEKKSFVNFIVAHKIASLYLNTNTEQELELIKLLNNIIESNNNLNLLIKDAIIEYGLVKQNGSQTSNYNLYYDIYYYQ